MEGDAYYRIFAGVALSFLKDAGKEGADADAVAATKAKFDAISAKMAYTLAEADITAKTDHCDVKNKGKEHYFYIPQSDVFNVGELSLDVADLKSKTSEGKYTEATTTYTDGLHALPHKVKDITTRDDTGQMFFDGYAAMTGSKTSFDDIITPALAGTGVFADKDASIKDSFRNYAVSKCGIAALQLQTMHFLEKALTDAAAGTAGAADTWDQAYAVFVGVPGGAAGTVGQLKSQGGDKGVMQKRDGDFPAPAVQARDQIMKHFAAGQKALLGTYDATAATAAADEIRRLIGITFARATIKYSSTMKPADGYEAGPHAEGFCYWRAMAGWMSKKAGKNTAAEIDALLALSKNDADITQPDLHCSVKQKLETMLPGTGISCDDIGAYKDDTLYTCPADTYGTCSSNRGTETTFGGYDVGASNFALAGVVEDIASIGSLGSDFDKLKTIYTDGEHVASPTLQNFAKADYTAGTGDYTAGNTYKAFNELFPPTAGEAGRCGRAPR